MRWLQVFKHLNRSVEVYRCLKQFKNPLSIVFAYLGLRDCGYPYQLILRNGIKLELQDFYDLVTAWIIFLREEYRPQIDAITLLDIGANIGCFTLKEAGQNDATRIVAVEPFPSTFSRLAVNISTNGMQNRVRCLAIGIAEKAGLRQMCTQEAPSQSRGILPTTEAQTAQVNLIDVPVLTLEELLQRACTELQTNLIDFVKIDIEGGEHAAIQATPLDAFKCVYRLGMEYHPNQPKEPTFERLLAAGFRLESDQQFGTNVGVAHFRRG